MPSPITKKPTPLLPSVAIASPAENRRSLKDCASCFSSRSDSSGEEGNLADELGGSCHARESLPVRARRVDPSCQLLDPPLGGLELLGAEPVELLAALPERRAPRRGPRRRAPAARRSLELLLCLLDRSFDARSEGAVGDLDRDRDLRARRRRPSGRAHLRGGRSRSRARGSRAARGRAGAPPDWASAARRRSTSRAGARRSRSRVWPRRCAWRSSVAAGAAAERLPRAARGRRAAPRGRGRRGGRRPSASRRAGRRRGRRAGVSCSWPTAVTIGTGHSATARTSRSSLKGRRSSKPPPPRARTTTSTSGSSQIARSASTIAVAARAALDERLGDQRRVRAESAPGSRSSTSRFAAASLPVTSPIRRGRRGSGRLRLSANRPSAASFCFSRSSAARCSPRPKRSIERARSRSSPFCSQSSGRP